MSDTLLPTTLERSFLRRYRRRLLKAVGGPFNSEASHRLECVDILLGHPRPTATRELWERVDTPDGKFFVPLGK